MCDMPQKAENIVPNESKMKIVNARNENNNKKY